MSDGVDRRGFLIGATSAAAITGLGDFRFLGSLPPLSAAEVRVPANIVRLESDIEPLVRFLEETPRERLVEETARRIRSGTSYQQLLAALFLAGVRNVRPRPVGFQFHTVLSVNSAHLASIAASDRDRWLPLFWAVDNFKASEATDRRENNWTMPPISENSLPPATQARRRFIAAMDGWDEEAAQPAVASLVRSAGAHEVIELFFRYGVRDFRSIGHKAIFVANGWRALQTIGWRHAEPIMRSMTDALLAHEGDNPARRDDERDRPYRENLQRLRRIRRDWQQGRPSDDSVRELLAAFRTANAADICERIVREVNAGLSPRSVWDAVFLIAGEMLMQRPGIVGLHCVTTANAMYYAYQTTASDETRRLVMLQAAAFMPMFRDLVTRRQRLVHDERIDRMEAAELTARQAGESFEEILADVSRDRLRAARKTLRLLSQDESSRAEALMAAARRLIFTKGNNSHDYKFSSAALEDFYHVSPAWRGRFLATAMFNLRGSGDPDNQLIARARQALQRT